MEYIVSHIRRSVPCAVQFQTARDEVGMTLGCNDRINMQNTHTFQGDMLRRSTEGTILKRAKKS